MFKRLFASLITAIAPTFVAAGDPCPIFFQIHDLGSPPWLDNAELISALESEQTWLGFRYEQGGEGLDVALVYIGSPMHRAGITSDDTILTINGQLMSSPAALANILDTLTPGQPLEMQVSDGAATRNASVTVGTTDPVPFAIVGALLGADCRNAELRQINPGIRDQVLPALYDANRRFRCDDAHEALTDVYSPAIYDDVFILRGTRRIIISMPNWGTTCINVADLDGANLTAAAALAALEPAIAAYVADRHANP